MNRTGWVIMASCEIVYLGPTGTFSYEIARKRFGRARCKLVSRETIEEVCWQVAAKPSRKGILPIENSTSGPIYSSVDALLDDRLDLHILEEISIDVSLALLGRKKDDVHRIYTHFAPKRHCREWIAENYPDAELVEVATTAAAAREASYSPHSAAISNRMAARLYGLEVIHYPLPGTVKENVTQFLVISRKLRKSPRIAKTSLAVHLRNDPGSLYDFLRPMAEARINLSRIISRPIEGKLGQVAFLIDIDGNFYKPKLSTALRQARRSAKKVRLLGSYPCYRKYKAS
ncbi:MAG: prephenate dehydratase domain-containing protein [Kiritimatiellia bacterium]